jgi:hypothetical protein
MLTRLEHGRLGRQFPLLIDALWQETDDIELKQSAEDLSMRAACPKSTAQPSPRAMKSLRRFSEMGLTKGSPTADGKRVSRILRRISALPAVDTMPTLNRTRLGCAGSAYGTGVDDDDDDETMALLRILTRARNNKGLII